MNTVDGEQKNDEVALMFEKFAQWTPTLPDSVVSYYLSKGGLNMYPEDKRIIHAVSASAQSLITSIINSAIEQAKQRMEQSTSTPSGAKKVLTVGDLSAALRSYGLTCPQQPLVGTMSEMDAIATKTNKTNEEEK